MGESVYLMGDRWRRYLHVHQGDGDPCMSVDVSLSETRWKIIPFAPFSANSVPNLLYGGSMIRLRHLESSGFLHHGQFSSHDDDLAQNSSTEAPLSPRALRRRISDGASEQIQPGRVMLRKSKGNQTNAIWQFETLVAEFGGLPLASGIRVRLRHVPTGLFLALDDEHHVCCVADVPSQPIDGSTVFALHVPEKAGQYISVDAYVQLHHESSGFWLHSTSAMELVGSKRQCEKDYFGISLPDVKEIEFLQHIMAAWKSAQHHLHRLTLLIAAEGIAAVTYTDVQPTTAVFRSLATVLDTTERKKYQKILREHNVVTSCLAYILLVVEYGTTGPMRGLMDKLFALLTSYVTDDFKNQISIAEYVPKLEEMIGDTKSVAAALSATIRGNATYLNGISRQRVVTLLESLVESKCTPEILEYLGHYCCRESSAMRKNQTYLLDELLIRRKHLIPMCYVDVDSNCVMVLIDGTTERFDSQLSEDTSRYVIQAYRLLARICEGRHSFAQARLLSQSDMKLDYENMIRLIQSQVEPHFIAAACDLVIQLHVDREPNVRNSAVILTRNWDDPSSVAMELNAYATDTCSLDLVPVDLNCLQSFVHEFMTQCIEKFSEQKALSVVRNQTLKHNFYSAVDQAQGGACSHHTPITASIDIVHLDLLASVLSLCRNLTEFGQYRESNQMLELFKLLFGILRASKSLINETMTKIKLEICEVMHNLYNFRLNIQLSYLLLYSKTGRTNQDNYESVFAELIEAELMEAKVENYAEIMVSLTQHGDRALTRRANKLLIRYFHPLKEMSRLVSRMQLLDPKFTSFFSFFLNVQAAFESEFDLKLLKQMRQKFRKAPPDMGKRMCRLMINLRIHEFLIKHLKGYDVSVPALSTSYQILEFVLDHEPEFRVYLFSHLDLLISHLPKHPVYVAGIIRRLLSNNRELISTISAERVERIVSILGDQNHWRVLEVLCQLVVCLDGPIQHNQNLVLKALVTCRCRDNVLVLYTGEEGIEARAALMRSMDQSLINILDADDETFVQSVLYCSSLSTDVPDDAIDCSKIDDAEKLRYHIRLLQLLNGCALGKNHLAEVQCRSLLSLEDLVDGVLHPDTILPVKKVLLALLDTMYIDVHVPIRGLGQSPLIWTIIDACIGELEYLIDFPQSQITFLDYIASTLCPLLANFYLHLFGRGWKPEQRHFEITQRLLRVCHELIERAECKETVRLSVVEVSTAILESDPAIEKPQGVATKVALEKRRLNFIGVEPKRERAIVLEDSNLEDQVQQDLRELLLALGSTKAYDRLFGSNYKKFLDLLRSERMNGVVRETIRLQDNVRFVRSLLNGSEKQQCRLSRLGASVMVLNLIPIHLSGKRIILTEALELGIGLLKNGNRIVQQAMYDHVISFDERFFEGLVRLFQHDSAEKKVSKGGSSSMRYSTVSSSMEDTVEGGVDDSMSDLLEFLRLLCEDHFLPMQNYLREQPDNAQSHNVIDQIVSYLQSIQWVIDPRSNAPVWAIDSAAKVDLCRQILYTLIEFAQGCPENQRLLSSFKLCHAMNDILVHCTQDDVRENVILLLYSLVEGCHDSRVIQNIYQFIDFSALNRYSAQLKARYLKVNTVQDWSRCCTTYIACKTIIHVGSELQVENEAVFQNPLLRWSKLSRSIGCIEIIRENQLEKLYFPIPTACLKYWEAPSIQDSRRRMKYIFTRENQTDKLEVFHAYGNLLLEEIHYSETIDQSTIARCEKQWMNLTFGLSFVLNLLNISDQAMARGEMAYSSNFLHVLSLALGLAHLIVASIRLRAYTIARHQAIINEFKWSQVTQKDSLRSKTFETTTNVCPSKMDLSQREKAILVISNARYNILYFGASFLGFVMSFIQIRGVRLVCYSFTLLDICVRNRTLRNVLMAMDQNKNALAQTFLLVMVVVFIYTTIGFAFFDDSYQIRETENTGCRSVLECLVTHFNQGLREDTGIASQMEIITWQDAPSLSIFRLIFDVSYWLVITVLLLNIVSGIIIDTFGELRDLRSAIEKDMETKCFICGIER